MGFWVACTANRCCHCCIGYLVTTGGGGVHQVFLLRFAMWKHGQSAWVGLLHEAEGTYASALGGDGDMAGATRKHHTALSVLL